MNLIWLRGLLRRRAGRLLGAAVGVALAVALVASVGSFLAASKATMTERAVHSVAVDWQVELTQGADLASVVSATASAPGVRTALPVGLGQTTGLISSIDGSTQTTGPGVVLGLPPGYRDAFPGVLRTLSGADTGVLLAQQTAANLHVQPGDPVSIQLAGGPTASVMVEGIVDLPQADSLFQKVGAPPGSQPSAPPDNVVLLPDTQWHQIYDPQAQLRPDQVATQLHVSRTAALSPDPAAAYAEVTSAAHNLEARTSGGALVGNNQGAALDAARSDAAYAQVLFLFLGLPGAVLAGLMTAAVAGAGAVRRRREQSLLRTRGASAGGLLRLAALEAAVVGLAGTVVGLGGAALVGQLAFGSARFGTTGLNTLAWAGLGALVGVGIAAATVLLPVRRDLRSCTVVAGRSVASPSSAPLWKRYGLDLLALAVAAAIVLVTTQAGYQLVLAPEGVPAISVSYWAFAGPALIWLGGGLLIWRLADLALGRGRGLLGRALRPLAGNLSSTVAASLSRQRRALVRGIVLLALAVSFAISTSTFNATYQQQAEADAQLTNGADVTVTESPGVNVGPAAAADLRSVPGVVGVEPVQHRFAYVGADLQDLYGVMPASIGSVTALQDAYFQGGSATQLLDELAQNPDSILVSSETVIDFQLEPGDLINLRLQDGRTQQLRTVPFHYAGIVLEFPTAPRDSFFVANADYIAQTTGSDAVGAFLVDTAGHDAGAVADQIRATLGPSARVTDISSVRAAVGSSLTSVDLGGLTRVELSFALLLAAASGGLVLALGLAERRRSFAIATALGANGRQLSSFVVAEAGLFVAAGLVAGACLGWVMTRILVKVLTGVFDPAPSSLAVPWTYLTVIGLTTLAAVGVVAAGTVRLTIRPSMRLIREL
ncbi:MAG: ABC transporter permease [Geodermatophilaceae bacterium]